MIAYIHACPTHLECLAEASQCWSEAATSEVGLTDTLPAVAVFGVGLDYIEQADEMCDNGRREGGRGRKVEGSCP